MPLSPEFLETQRQKLGNNADKVIDNFYLRNGNDNDYKKFRSQFTAKYGDAATGSMLDFYAYGTVNPTERFDLEKKREPSFFGRFGESILSVPERAKRSFGTQEIREGRTETSKGFDIADIPGDIADVIGPSLPFFGAMAGGLAASPTLPTGPLGLAAITGGGAAGGLAGEEARQTIGRSLGVQPQEFGKTTEQLEESKSAAIRGGAQELTGAVIGKVAQKVLKPFSKLFDREVAQVAQKTGVELPASALSKSPAVQQTEAIAGKGLFGAPVRESIEQATKQMDIIADDIVRSARGSDDLTVAGKSALEGADRFKDSWIAAKNKLYSSANNLLRRGNKKPSMEQSLSFLDDILKNKDSAKRILGDIVDVKRLETIRRNLRKGASIEDISNAITELNQLTKFGRSLVTTGDEGALKKLAATMSRELDDHIISVDPQLGSALQAADEKFIEGINLLDSEFGKQLAKLSDEPTKIVDAVIKPKSPNQVREFFKLIGDDAKRDIQSSFLRGIIEKSRNAQSGTISGAGLTRIINRFGRKTLEEAIGKHRLSALEDVATIGRAIAQGQKVSEGSQTAFISKLFIMGSGLFTSMTTANPMTAFATLGLVLGDAGLVKFVSSQTGRRLLTEGFDISPAVMEAIRLGGRAAIPALDQLFREP